METAVSTVHRNHCASSVALKRLNLLTAAAQTLHLPHCVTDRVQLRSLAAHWKLRPLSFAYSAQRSQLNRPKCSLFGGVQMQRLFSMSFLRIWNTFSFHKHHQCTAVQWVKRCGGKSALCPIMISSLRSEISANLDCDTWIRVSSNFFSIQTEYQRQGLLDLMNMLFKRKGGLMNIIKAGWFKCDFHQVKWRHPPGVPRSGW